MSEVLQGMVFTRQVEGDVVKKANAKIAVYSCPFDSMQTETKVSHTRYLVKILISHYRKPCLCRELF